MSFGLTDRAVGLICACFSNYEGVEKVKVFGSRALDTQRDNSDIDLVYWGKLSNKEYNSLYEELENLPLPYLFDLKSYDEIKHPKLKEHIDRVAKSFYKRRNA